MATQSSKIDSEVVVDIVAKGTLGLIPYIGSFLSEIVTYRSQVKQKRLLRFVELVGDYIESLGGVDQAALSSLDSEQFGDLLESIARRVTQTSSEQKMKRFAHILVDHIQAPVDEEYSETFLDMVTQLSEKQIEILSIFSDAGNQYRIRKSASVLNQQVLRLNEQVNKEKGYHSKGLANNLATCQHELVEAQHELTVNKTLIEENNKTQQGGYYGISEEHYKFLIQDLYSKSLLVDIGIGTVGTEPFQVMDITSFGKELLHFIRETVDESQLDN